MKNLLLIAILAAVAWHLFQRQEPPVTSAIAAPQPQSLPTPLPAHRPAPMPGKVHGFHCDGREYCSQMTSRAEAEFFTRHCPNAKMDGDGDGIPCENDTRF